MPTTQSAHHGRRQGPYPQPSPTVMDADADVQLRAQVDFSARLRAALFANSGSTNVDALDTVAVAVLADDASCPVELPATVTLLPLPDTLQVVVAPAHDLFTAPAAPARSLAKRATTRSASKAPPSKKQRKSKVPDQDDDDVDDEEDANDDGGTEAYEFPLPDKCPVVIRRDIVKIIKQADARDKTPPRVAYPWVGQRACPTQEEVERRPGATAFLSLNIIAFGYYGFLDAFENGTHDNLMWLGGKAARRSAAAKANARGGSDASALTDLATLYRNDRGRYDAVIARALDPYRVDEDGYQSIPELLEQTKALDPTKPTHLRLSDEALARVVIDVTSCGAPNSAWVGNKSSGTWKLLLGDARIRALVKKLTPLVRKGKQPFPPQKAYNEDKEQRDDYSDFEDDEDMFTVLPPTPHLDEEEDGEPDELDDQLPDDDSADHEDDDDRSSVANEPMEDGKKDSTGNEEDDTTSKKKIRPPPSPKPYLLHT
ncbi:unnamed protein product [Phytophthora fragariaefolia]|uniref:Unnamed protein product n=1 Tax=Phytophthora fragariaefolia TaxID=1490495 RepID=A0A9W6XLB3_9STRA|nr:unnamed protein product [Phytophthora fragariaefolia]